MHTKLSSDNLKGREHLGDTSADEMIILKWILEELGWRCGMDSSGSEWVLVAGSCERC